MVANDPRAALLDAVRAYPGSSIREIARRVGRQDATAEYHLRRLEKLGVLVSEPRGRERAWFLASCGLCPVLRRAVPALRREEALRVALGVTDTPLPVSALAARTGLASSQVRWAARALVDAFLLERSEHGRVRLREGAGVCVSMAASATRCTLWGKCQVSRAWRGRGGPEPPTAAARARG